MPFSSFHSPNTVYATNHSWKVVNGFLSINIQRLRAGISRETTANQRREERYALQRYVVGALHLASCALNVPPLLYLFLSLSHLEALVSLSLSNSLRPILCSPGPLWPLCLLLLSLTHIQPVTRQYEWMHTLWMCNISVGWMRMQDLNECVSRPRVDENPKFHPPGIHATYRLGMIKHKAKPDQQKKKRTLINIACLTDLTIISF